MSQRKRARAAVVGSFLALAMISGQAVGVAHPVSEFGTPSCFGERISHGSASGHASDGHELTPTERTALLQEVVDFVLEFGSEEEIAFVMEFFGETVDVSEFMAFVKLNCSDDPLFFPF